MIGLVSIGAWNITIFNCVAAKRAFHAYLSYSSEKNTNLLNRNQLSKYTLKTVKMSSIPPKPTERLLLIDTDAGTDDAWALFLALKAHKTSEVTGVKIVGITTVCGNTAVKNVSVNVTRTLDTVKETTIPIYEGMTEYMAHDFTFFSPPWDGQDGFGDVGLPPITPRLQKDHAVMAIIRLAEEHKGKLTIVCLGPLTNLAMAVKLKPEIKTYIKELFILGGTFNGQGNATAAAEFNFFCDPESAFMCIDSYTPKCKTTLLPWETCLKATSTMQFRTDVLGKMDTPAIKLMNKVEEKNLKRMTDWFPADAVLMACVVDPKVITATQATYARVETAGKYTRGMLVVDKGNSEGQPANLTVITDLNKTSYETYLAWAVCDKEVPPAPPAFGLVSSVRSYKNETEKKTSENKLMRTVGRKVKSCKKAVSKCFGN